MLAAYFFRRLVRIGDLTVIDADGRTHFFSGAEVGPDVTIRLHDRALHRRIMTRPYLAFGEAYMDGTLTSRRARSTTPSISPRAIWASSISSRCSGCATASGA